MCIIYCFAKNLLECSSLGQTQKCMKTNHAVNLVTCEIPMGNCMTQILLQGKFNVLRRLQNKISMPLYIPWEHWIHMSVALCNLEQLNYLKMKYVICHLFIVNRPIKLL